MQIKKPKLSKIEKQLENATEFPLNTLTGLTDEQVAIRKEEGLVNKSIKHVTKSVWRILRDNVLNFFNILLIAIGIGMGFAQLPFMDFAFLFILGFNIAIGLFQDLRARKLTQKLQIISTAKVRVLRNGREIDIKSEEIVVSDIIILYTGDQIVADGEIVDGALEVNESMLTGEAVDVKKLIGSQVLSGSYVTGGSAKMIVKSIGKASYAEKLQEKAKEFKRPKSEILKSINNVFNIIEGVVITLGIALIVTYAIAGDLKYNPDIPMANSLFQKTVRSIAGSLVSMIPTGMYLLTSSTLAVGVVRLATKRMLVQELYCIEMLARVDTLCLDKTGTITDGTMVVSEVIPLDTIEEKEIGDILLTLARATKDANNTANALVQKYKDNKLIKYHSAIPFSSKRKYSAVMLSDGRSFVLGAREFVGVESNSIARTCMKYEARGQRVMLLALSHRVIDSDEKLSGLTPIAIIVLEDNIKPDAVSNIEWFRSNGVKIKIISGDNALSVSKIAEKVGVLDSEEFVSLDGKSLEEVRELANNNTVFGRVTPEQKEALISAMKDAGHVVAMTGDGVNDILALKSADCSIAMASGSQAAKNVAHLVSLDSNFSALPDVVREGRRVINNLQRTISLFLCKTIFAAVMTALFIILYWKDGSQYPYITRNLYVWELLNIGLASFFLSFQPNNERLKNGSFKRNIYKNSLPGGLLQVFTACAFLIIHSVIPEFFSKETMIAMTVVTFSITSFVILLTICFPFDIYRAVLAGAIGFLIGAFFYIDSNYLVGKIDPNSSTTGMFGIDYTRLTSNNWWMMLVVGGVMILVYLGAMLIINDLFRRADAREEAKNED